MNLQMTLGLNQCLSFPPCMVVHIADSHGCLSCSVYESRYILLQSLLQSMYLCPIACDHDGHLLTTRLCSYHHRSKWSHKYQLFGWWLWSMQVRRLMLYSCNLRPLWWRTNSQVQCLSFLGHKVYRIAHLHGGQSCSILESYRLRHIQLGRMFPSLFASRRRHVEQST